MQPNYGRTFSLLRAECAQLWSEYTYHSFVEGLRDGSLKRGAFLNYLRQDYVFLIHFARAWSLAIVKSGNLAEMREASAIVHTLLHFEMALHVRVCEEAGISQAELEATEEAPENLAYTRYVLETGYSGDYLALLAALAPCALGYGEIGARLLVEAGDTPYRDWIETYGGDECQKACHDFGALFDRAVKNRLGQEPEKLPIWRDLSAKFRMATKLEISFWGLGRENG